MENGSNGSANGSATGQDFLRAENLVKRFGAVEVLKGVDMHVKRGEVLGLIGDNGAGKSTLLKTITGFHRPDGGRLLIEGQEVNLRSVSQARSLASRPSTRTSPSSTSCPSSTTCS
jgi:ABC-type sugar transport system ATPase subunit